MSTKENGVDGAAAVEQPSDQMNFVERPSVVRNPPYLPARRTGSLSLKDNRRVLVIGAGIVLILLLIGFSGIANKRVNARKGDTASKMAEQPQLHSGAPATESTTPIMDVGREPNRERDETLLDPDQIAHTVTRRTKPATPADLGSIPPFDNQQSWQPPPFQPGSPAQRSSDPNANAERTCRTDAQREPDSMDKASLVFLKRESAAPASSKPQDAGSAMDWELGLKPGTHLRAKLEATVSTAIRTPVVAVVEYNYEQNDQIIVPAGTRVFGHLESADRSGYVEIRFDSMMLPDGTSVTLEATATDLQLRPLRGKVEGKRTSKNLLVRSFTGVGQIGTALIGRGSLDQPLSETDLLRERLSNNIGEASDQAVGNLAITENIVVSIPADTAIYVVLQKPSSKAIRSPQAPPPANTPSDIEQLRQLMQLQRELNQTELDNGSRH